jgi:serine/threonine protein phosphatase PrpC
MVEMGMLTEAQAKEHPDANVVTRALGYSQLADGTIIEPDVRPEPIALEVGDSIVMCSDGLYDDVEDGEIGDLMQGRSAKDASELLVRTSNGRSGHDNITCTVMHWGAIQGGFNPMTRPTTIQSVVGVPKKKSNATLAVVVALLGVIVAVVGFVIYTQMAAK